MADGQREICQECSAVGKPGEPLIFIWGDGDDPEIYCAICLDNAPLDDEDLSHYD